MPLSGCQKSLSVCPPSTMCTGKRVHMCRCLAVSRSEGRYPGLGPPNHDLSSHAFWFLMASTIHSCYWSCLSHSSEWPLWNKVQSHTFTPTTRYTKTSGPLHTGSGKPGAYSQSLHTTAVLSLLSCQTWLPSGLLPEFDL